MSEEQQYLDLIREVLETGEFIGFTDFAYEVEEGSKSEIFRRCDAGASNENASP